MTTSPVFQFTCKVNSVASWDLSIFDPHQLMAFSARRYLSRNSSVAEYARASFAFLVNPWPSSGKTMYPGIAHRGKAIAAESGFRQRSPGYREKSLSFECNSH